MCLSKSIDFLLDKGGDVLKYRLHKEILKDLSPSEEEALLEKVLESPHYQLLTRYAKPNGYIGVGMHSLDKYKETPLQDGEAAARLLSNYAIPKESPIVRRFVAALRNDEILEQEFSYRPSEAARFRNRYLGLNNGGGLMVLVYTCQALLGYGDDQEVLPFVFTSFHAFQRLLHIRSLDDITTFNPRSKRKYNYPYLEQDAYFPCQYHLETLAHTQSWRSEAAVSTLAKAVNHHDRIMKGGDLHVKIGGSYSVPLWAYTAPFQPYDPARPGDAPLRKTLTHLAMAGGSQIDVVRQSADALREAIAKDGILRVDFESPYRKRAFKQGLRFPTPYSEIALEPSYRTDTALWCELTFWAVQLLSILEQEPPRIRP